MKLSEDKIIEWNGGEETGLAQYLAWVLESNDNRKKALEEIGEY